MHFNHLLVAALPLAAQAVNVVVSNDDGWAEINIREFYYALTDAGFDAFISAPAENESGTGSDAAKPSKATDGCEYSSCPSGSPATGHNASMPKFNYVNSYPVTSMKYGIKTLAPKFFDGAPGIAVAGPNVGSNLGTTTLISGTVGAATEASKLGVPGLAFSGATGDQTAWNVEPVPSYSKIYGELAANVTQTLTRSGTPYLAKNIWLNVNFPDVTSTCASASDFKFVLSRINTATAATPSDVVTCGDGGRLPTETTVVDTAGCYSAISVGIATTKMDADAKQQKVVLDKLSSILTCLPGESS